MPKVNVRGMNLYYEVHGSGYPLILIRGLGSNADHWYCQLPAFSPHFSVVVFDNRGIARSDVLDEAFTISTMADDTVLLMDVLGIAKAQVGKTFVHQSAPDFSFTALYAGTAVMNHNISEADAFAHEGFFVIAAGQLREGDLCSGIYTDK